MDNLNIPTHVAIVLDGNGRWAKKKHMPRTYGHKNGAENVVDICLYAKERGVKYMTLYAFSTENWKRPLEEVNYLMKLVIKFIESKLDILMEENCKLNFIGDLEKLPAATKEICIRAMEDTKDNDEITLNIALNYGGRDELVHAFKLMLDEGVSKEDVTEEMISSYLYTKDQPDPDLLIRPGGELRLSNFLIYQLAYAEFYFTDTLWPDFDRKAFDEALEEFSRRNRRYGALS
ncbi:MAG: isoprenyl transferase [Anaerococcus prevotii]|uniref:isoprenyl transferase n=1 Tax=Anaerococcus prevotii TaxID=33034 RepID=UPI0028FE3E39|nr:isoprenyl transferase [Anaerococcus prevotii]MDU2557748.1 isoprenyl transferase [Anaerococcus prevotii]MDU3137388.1 isoprenyl transferase [Anaerococcus prevotii]